MSRGFIQGRVIVRGVEEAGAEVEADDFAIVEVVRTDEDPNQLGIISHELRRSYIIHS